MCIKKYASTMLKSESLIQLVNNLTKQEKKEFSLYITNKSEKDYIFLFRYKVTTSSNIFRNRHEYYRIDDYNNSMSAQKHY